MQGGTSKCWSDKEYDHRQKAEGRRKTPKAVGWTPALALAESSNASFPVSTLLSVVNSSRGRRGTRATDRSGLRLSTRGRQEPVGPDGEGKS
jgi:hypothetical protein